MMIVCPSCGTQNRDTAYYCSNCAAALRTTRQCPNCGISNPIQAKFCQNCATALRGDTPITGLTGKLAPNTILAERYKIIQKLGQGGMGAVYKVRDLRLGGKYWAVKEMSDAALVEPHDKQLALQAFQNEANLLASLRHPNLTQVMDYFENDAKHYLVMDFINGETLEEMLEVQIEPFTESLVIDWAVQIGNVLDYLHSQPQPIIFRDLKPGNVMLEDDGKIKLIDFGIARLFKPGKQKDTTSFGTAGYAPPEQFGRGQTDARSDIYSLGVMLHQLLTLRNPQDEPFIFPLITQFNPGVSPKTDQAIQKALNQNPNERWQNVREFIDSLQMPEEKVPITTEIPLKDEPKPVVQPQNQGVLPSQGTSTPITAQKKLAIDPKGIGTYITSHRLLVYGAATLLLLGVLITGFLMFDLIPSPAPQPAVIPLQSSSFLFNSNRDRKLEIYRVNASGDTIRVTNLPGERESWNAITNRGSVFFTSNRDGKREIYRMDNEGRTTRVTNSPGDSESWSAAISSGDKLIFVSNRDGKREIYRMDENGTTTRVTNSPGDSESWSPIMSPGGKLLFVSNRDGKREIYRMEENGVITRVTNSPGDSECWSPAISPGGMILFVSNRDGKREIYRMDEDGITTRVTNSPGASESWSPGLTTTRKMIYTSNRDGKDEIYRMNENGDVVQVTNTPGTGESWTFTEE